VRQRKDREYQAVHLTLNSSRILHSFTKCRWAKVNASTGGQRCVLSMTYQLSGRVSCHCSILDWVIRQTSTVRILCLAFNAPGNAGLLTHSPTYPIFACIPIKVCRCCSCLASLSLKDFIHNWPEASRNDLDLVALLTLTEPTGNHTRTNHQS